MKHRHKLVASKVRNRRRRKTVVNPTRIDPSRTIGLRRPFTAAIKRKFALLKGRIVKLFLTDDVLGLKRQAQNTVVNSTVVSTKLPVVRQTTDYSCGAACFAAVAQYYGITPATERAAIAALGTSQQDGTSPSQILQLAQRVGLAYGVYYGMELGDLQALNCPVIASVTMYGGGHYVVVTEVADGVVKFMDPSAGYRSLPVDQFLLLWYDDEGGVQLGIVLWAEQLVDNANPNHDEKGRFSTAAGLAKVEAAPSIKVKITDAGAPRQAVLDRGQLMKTPLKVDSSTATDDAIHAVRDHPDVSRTEETVPISSLVGRQIAVSKETIKGLLRAGPRKQDPTQPTDLPIVVEVGSKRYLYDGHHRITADKLAGMKTARVVMYRLAPTDNQIVRDALGRFAKQAGQAEHWVTSRVAKLVNSLPFAAQLPIKTAYFALMATHMLGQEAAERVARERGLTDEQAKRLRGVLTTIDTLAAKPSVLAGEFTGVGPSIGFVPLASTGYLMYSTARDPMATYRAAKRAVKDVISSAKSAYDTIRNPLGKVGLAINADQQIEDQIANQLATYHYDDWYIALLHASLEQDPDLDRAIEVAAKAYQTDQQPPTDNTAEWAYMPDAEKIKAFQQWLASQLQELIIGDSEQQLWEEYCRQGYLKGAGRAFDDVNKSSQAGTIGDQSKLDFYNGSRDQFLRSSFGQAVSVEKVKLLAGRSFDDLEGVTSDMSTKMSRALTDGLVQGKGMKDIASDLSEQADLSKERALTVARTEIIRAHAEGQLDAMEDLGLEEVGVAVEWSTANDNAVCEDCAPMEGVVLKIDEAHGMIPAHPNAIFAGSTFIPYGECLEIVRANYSGPGIMLHTTGTREYRTTIGPNHPMLTDRGMIKAADLHIGDKVVYDLRHERMSRDWSLRAIDNKQIPLAENVFQSCMSTSINSLVTTSSSNLHGDREFCQGEVQAVSPARGLLRILDSNGIEKCAEVQFSRTNADQLSVSAASPDLLSFLRVDLPSPSSMSSPDSRITTNNRHFILLEITQITKVHYTGLAFDGTTVSSLYCNNGFVVSNCRCAFIPANVGEDKADQKRSKSVIDKAVSKTDLDLDVDEDRPESVLNTSPQSVLSNLDVLSIYLSSKNDKGSKDE